MKRGDKCGFARRPSVRSPDRALVMSNGNNGEIIVNSVRDALLTICNPRLRTLRVLASSNVGQNLERAMRPVALALLAGDSDLSLQGSLGLQPQAFTRRRGVRVRGPTSQLATPWLAPSTERSPRLSQLHAPAWLEVAVSEARQSAEAAFRPQSLLGRQARAMPFSLTVTPAWTAKTLALLRSAVRRAAPSATTIRSRA